MAEAFGGLGRGEMKTQSTIDKASFQTPSDLFSPEQDCHRICYYIFEPSSCQLPNHPSR